MRTVVGGGRDTHDGHENSPILVFFSNLLAMSNTIHNAIQDTLMTIQSRVQPPNL